LALGAIFATTDSVAVLQVLEPDRAPLLFNLVFGEGVINDATTVALLRTIQVLHLPLSALDPEHVSSAHVVVLQNQHALPNWKLVSLPWETAEQHKLREHICFT
jgi:NhaP-type Na+/H+ or K+/H+ antiporter